MVKYSHLPDSVDTRTTYVVHFDCTFKILFWTTQERLHDYFIVVLYGLSTNVFIFTLEPFHVLFAFIVMNLLIQSFTYHFATFGVHLSATLLILI